MLREGKEPLAAPHGCSSLILRNLEEKVVASDVGIDERL